MKKLCVLLLALSAGCRSPQVAAPPAEKAEGYSVTDWTDKTELFMEYPPLVAGQTARFAVHFTRLDNFRALPSGRVEVRLNDETFSIAGPSRPGVFGVDVRPARTGKYTMTVSVRGTEVTDTHDMGEVTVNATETPRPVEKKTEETIAFLKEQQWALDFGTALVTQRGIRASLLVPAEVTAQPGGEGLVTVPFDGRLVIMALPPTGTTVAKNQILAQLLPPTTAVADLSAIELARAEAETSLQFARRDRERAQRLVDAGAAPARRLEEARSKEALLEAQLTAARARLAQYDATREAEGGSASGRLFMIRAPISGIIAESHAAPGANVRGGDALFRIVDADRVYVAGSVPEAELQRLRNLVGAELEIPGISGAKPVGRLVSVGRLVDVESRTIPVIYEVPNTDRRLAVGQDVSLRLFTSSGAAAPSVTESAIVDDAGRPVVFVQLTGEAFARRPVKLGDHESGYVQILEGVRTGERVVTRGAYLVRLSAMSSQIPAHGHVH